MCLAFITGKPKKKVGVGYKVYQNRTTYGQEHLPSGIYIGSFIIRERYILGQKYVAEGGPIKMQDGQEYPAGFHIFKTIKGARLSARYWGEVIVKVRYSGAYLEGIEQVTAKPESQFPCIVAKTVTLLEEVE